MPLRVLRGGYHRAMLSDAKAPGPPMVQLRAIAPNDLAELYLHQLDPESNRVAVANPRDSQAFAAHWAKVLADPGVVARAIIADGAMVGYITCFAMDRMHWVGYWIARQQWGRGIATCALRQLLHEVGIRPLHARGEEQRRVDQGAGAVRLRGDGVPHGAG